MSQKRIIVVGANAAGGSAAFKIKRINPETEVMLFDSDIHTSYAACGLPYYLSRTITDYHSLFARTEKDIKGKAAIKLYTSHRVNSLDLEKGEIIADDLNSGRESKYSFDQILLATGASPLVPNVDGVDLEGITTLRSLNSALNLDKLLRKDETNKVVIIGGSFIGLELAENLLKLGKEVRIIEKMSQVMPIMDMELAAFLEEELISNGVFVHKNESLIGFQGNSQGQLKEVITDKGTYEADLAILAMGVKPNNKLAKDANITLGVSGAIGVNRYQQTNFPQLYAAGDCAETYHFILKRNTYVPLGTTANRQGRLAAENMCGFSRKYSGSLGSSVVKVFDLSAARTGLSEKEAQTNKILYKAVTIKALDHASYYPGSSPIHIKLIFDPLTGQIMGGQMVGSEKAAKRIDVIATAITAKATIDELCEVDMAYAPPFAQVWDAITVAGNMARSKLMRDVKN